MNKNERYPYELIPLPYAYDALEPYIDEETMHLHHDKHLLTYVDNLNITLASCPGLQSVPLVTMLARCETLPENVRESVRNNGGGVYNHDLFFSLMAPAKGQKPEGALMDAITRSFGSFDRWKERFKAAALSRFGSGWAWLVVCHGGWLSIASTANQDVPFASGVYPILLLDVWEHAYYLKYQNRRAEYIDNWFNVVNWEAVGKRYEAYVNPTVC